MSTDLKDVSKSRNSSCFQFCNSTVSEGSTGGMDFQPLNGRQRGDHPAVKEIDSLIARELFQMSLNDREKALDDVHGIRKKEEDPNFVNSNLMKLEVCLNSIKVGSVYAEAEQRNEAYVQNRHFRILFLQAEHFDPGKAAARLLKFFDLKKRLFGADKLFQRITLFDLNSDDLEALKAGEAQISPLKDASGRTIVTMTTKLRKYKELDNVRRAMFYVYMAAMETRVAQTKGIVGVFYNVDTPQSSSVNTELRSSLPIRFASLHLCVNDISAYVKICATILSLSTHNRVRYRLHFGSHTECLYELITFGIPHDAIPVTGTGEGRTDEHTLWLEKRYEMEARLEAPRSLTIEQILSVAPTPSLNASFQSTNRPLLAPDMMVSAENNNVPTGEKEEVADNCIQIRENDVLFGRSKAMVDHNGNAKFRKLVDLYIHKYEEAERLEKACIAEAIVQMVKESQGRFMKKEPGSDWEEVDTQAARKKVAHAFRNRRKLHGYGAK